MFPLTWNFPFRKRNGNMVNLEDITSDVADTLNSEIQTLSNELTNEVTTRSYLTVHNLAMIDTESSSSGVLSWVVNADKSVTLNTSSLTESTIIINLNTNILLPAGDYVLSGCPQSSSGISCYLRVKGDIDYSTGDGAAQTRTSPKKDFTLTATNTMTMSIVVQSGFSGTQTFYPMIKLASDADETYHPFAMTNQQLTNDKLDTTTLKTVVAASNDFSDFKTRIAAL